MGSARADMLARKQANFRIDHNFNQAHKISGTYTYEYSYGTAISKRCLRDSEETGFRDRSFSP
jgi:hypothetical protein